MPCYAAHAILYVKFKDGTQDCFPVWENVYLIEAGDGERVRDKAVSVAKADEGDDDGTFTWDGRPAEWVLAGIRKIISVSHAGTSDAPGNGDELTYSAFCVTDAVALRQLADGRAVTVQYDP